MSRRTTKLITAITRHHQQQSYTRAHQTGIIRQQRLIIKSMRCYAYSKNKDRVAARKKETAQKCEVEMKDVEHEPVRSQGNRRLRHGEPWTDQEPVQGQTLLFGTGDEITLGRSSTS